jgi:hypothetical protein
MRKVVIALGVVLVAVLTVGTVAAKPQGGGGAPVVFGLVGSFTALGIEVPFSGTLTVDRFAVVEDQLVVEGELAAEEVGLFPAAEVTVVAHASPSADPATGDCTVEMELVSTILLGDSFVTLEEGSTAFELGGADSGQDLCGVVKASDKDPLDQAAIARALNRALGMS